MNGNGPKGQMKQVGPDEAFVLIVPAPEEQGSFVGWNEQKMDILDAIQIMSEALATLIATVRDQTPKKEKSRIQPVAGILDPHGKTPFKR